MEVGLFMTGRTGVFCCTCTCYLLLLLHTPQYTDTEMRVRLGWSFFLAA